MNEGDLVNQVAKVVGVEKEADGYTNWFRNL